MNYVSCTPRPCLPFNFVPLILYHPAGTLICTVIGHAANLAVNCVLLFATYSRNKYCLIMWMASAAFVIVCSPVPIIWATYIGLQVFKKVEKFYLKPSDMKLGRHYT